MNDMSPRLRRRSGHVFSIVDIAGLEKKYYSVLLQVARQPSQEQLLPAPSMSQPSREAEDPFGASGAVRVLSALPAAQQQQQQQPRGTAAGGAGPRSRHAGLEPAGSGSGSGRPSSAVAFVPQAQVRSPGRKRKRGGIASLQRQNNSSSQFFWAMQYLIHMNNLQKVAHAWYGAEQYQQAACLGPLHCLMVACSGSAPGGCVPLCRPLNCPAGTTPCIRLSVLQADFG